MRTLLAALLSLALLAPAARAQTDTLAVRGVRRDSVVPGAARLAAAKTIPELLAARVPGLQVRPGSGAVASGARLRLRGASGILVPGEPLVVVDGVRVVSEPNDLLGEVDQAPSRLDDFLPDDVERVEVLSGPAAVARYGPEGVNGVVEVFTRRGTPGRPRFHGFAEAGTRSDVTAYPANFGRVGLGSGGTRTTACSLNRQAFAQCTPVATRSSRSIPWRRRAPSAPAARGAWAGPWRAAWAR